MIALARVPLARLVRAPRAWLPIAFWGALALAGAWLGHARGGAHAADHVLLGPYASIILPLVAYAIVSGVVGGDGLARSGRGLVGLGAHPARVALASIAVAAIAAAAVLALVGAGVAAIAHGESDPPLGGDVAVSAWTSALGGAAYAAYFALGSGLGARGAGRTVLLVADWVLGSTDGPLGALFPRAHVRNLLGGDPVLDLTQPVSAAILAAMVVAFGGLALLRARR